MIDDRELQAVIGSWLREPARVPDDLGEVLARLASTPQRRGWRPAPSTRGMHAMIGATRFILAAVVVALFGGFLVAGAPAPAPAQRQAPAAVAASPSPSGAAVASVPVSPLDAVPNVGRPLTTYELLALREALAPVRPPVAVVAEASIDLDPRMHRATLSAQAGRGLSHRRADDRGHEAALVHADRTVRELYQRARDSIDGILAFELRRYGLRFLGRMAVPPDGSLVQPVSPDTMAWADEINAGRVIAVDGWLSVLGWGVPCPAPSPKLVGRGDPDDSPFVRCPAGWISADAALPEQDPDGVAMTPPGFAIPVQASAYRDYASEPGEVADFMVPPRRGTYLLRHVGVNMGRPTGWEVVGRLEPLPAPTP